MAAGGILAAVVLLVVVPIAVMFAGAAWSALMGYLLADDADRRTG